MKLFQLGRTPHQIGGGVKCWTWDLRPWTWDWADKPKPAPMHRLDVPRGTGTIPQNPAEFPDTHRQRRVAHNRARPHGEQEFLFGRHLPWAGKQIPQHGKGFGRDPQLVGVVVDGVIVPIHAEGAKVDCF